MKKKLRIAVLFSGGASALDYLATSDPNYKVTYEIVCAVTNKDKTVGEDLCKLLGIPCIQYNAKTFCLGNGFDGLVKDMPDFIREEYFEGILGLLVDYQPELVLLSGFMLKISKPLLGTIPIINVHPADLRITGEDGKPKYRGDNAVFDAIQAGEKKVASTIHVVEKETDCGKIICVSEPIDVFATMSPKDTQDFMKTVCDGPAYVQALELIRSGEFVFN